MRKPVGMWMFAIVLVSNFLVHTEVCKAQGTEPDKGAGVPAPDDAVKAENGGTSGNENEIGSLPDCSSDQPKIYAPRSASLNIAVGPESEWRPVGGNVELHVSGDSAPISANLLWYRACFRWHNSNSDSGRFRPTEAMRWSGTTESNKTVINHFNVRVPDLPIETAGATNSSAINSQDSRLSKFWILKRADLRVIAIDPKGGIVADVTLPVRIIRVPFAVGVALFVTTLAFIVLWRFSLARGLKNGNFLLNIVATSKGYASLSQFQIMVWTLVTGAGAVYVISLSGNLIDLNSQILILLGITGATVIGSKLADNRNEPTAPPATVVGKPAGAADAGAVAPAVHDGDADAAPPVGAAADVASKVQDGDGAPAAKAAAVLARAVPDPGAVVAAEVVVAADAGRIAAVTSANQIAPPRRPKWSDLVVIESDGLPEIDVTRVQMFLFTVISAGFVLIKVFGSYEIPEIPNGYVELMGISNGVYLTKKFVT